MVNSSAFAELRPRIHWPLLPNCLQYAKGETDFKENKPNARYLACLLRTVALGSHHPGGSCAMGIETNESVVDQRFR